MVTGREGIVAFCDMAECSYNSYGTCQRPFLDITGGYCQTCDVEYDKSDPHDDVAACLFTIAANALDEESKRRLTESLKRELSRL